MLILGKGTNLFLKVSPHSLPDQIPVSKSRFYGTVKTMGNISKS